jgi:hypothetical protein
MRGALNFMAVLGVMQCVMGVFIWADGSAHPVVRQSNNQKVTDATNALVLVPSTTRAT